MVAVQGPAIVTRHKFGIFIMAHSVRTTKNFGSPAGKIKNVPFSRIVIPQ
jgi:hypothetical protein